MKETTPTSDIISRSMTIYANLVFLVLWVGFVAALVVNREWMDEAWSWAQALPVAPRIIVWVLFLPIMVGLWIWESSWPTFGRVVGFTGIVVWTCLAVYSLFKYFRQICSEGPGVETNRVFFDRARGRLTCIPLAGSSGYQLWYGRSAEGGELTELRRPTLGQRISLLVESLLLTVLVPKERVGRVFGLLFKLPLLFLRLRLGSLIPRNILILTTTGRRTGLLRRTPMEFSPGPTEGEYVVMAGWGGRTDWYRNARADPHVRVWLHGREWDAIAEPVPDHEVARLMMEATQVNPFARGIWSRWSDVPIDGSQESYIKAAPHFPSLYLRPKPPSLDTAGQILRIAIPSGRRWRQIRADCCWETSQRQSYPAWLFFDRLVGMFVIIRYGDQVRRREPVGLGCGDLKSAGARVYTGFQRRKGALAGGGSASGGVLPGAGDR